MSEHDDEIRAKCQWLIEQKYITSPVETGMLICEVFDAFKQIATLKAQLKISSELLKEVDDLFGRHMEDRWHEKLRVIKEKHS